MHYSFLILARFFGQTLFVIYIYTHRHIVALAPTNSAESIDKMRLQQLQINIPHIVARSFSNIVYIVARESVRWFSFGLFFYYVLYIYTYGYATVNLEMWISILRWYIYYPIPIRSRFSIAKSMATMYEYSVFFLHSLEFTVHSEVWTLYVIAVFKPIKYENKKGTNKKKFIHKQRAHIFK